MVGRILVGVDGSEGSRRALRWAIGEAAAHEAALHALIVWQSPYDFGEALYFPVDEGKLAEGAKQRVAESIAEVAGEAPGVQIDCLVVEGDPAETLCERSAEADLLVVGSRGHGGFAGLMLGSVSTKCAHHSRCPVVIVPKAQTRD